MQIFFVLVLLPEKAAVAGGSRGRDHDGEQAAYALNHDRSRRERHSSNEY